MHFCRIMGNQEADRHAPRLLINLRFHSKHTLPLQASNRLICDRPQAVRLRSQNWGDLWEQNSRVSRLSVEKLGLIVAFLIVGILVFDRASQAHWQKLVSVQGAFSVLMPEKPAPPGGAVVSGERGNHRGQVIFRVEPDRCLFFCRLRDCLRTPDGTTSGILFRCRTADAYAGR